MGNNSQNRTISEQGETEVFTHPYFEKAYPIEKEGQVTSIVARILLDNYKIYKQWGENMKNSPGLGVQGAFNPISHQFVKEGMCGSSGTAKVVLQNFPYTLKDEIKNRGLTQKKFKICQIWYLLAILTDVGEKFHNVGEKIGDVRPLNIFLNNDGEIKVLTHYSLPEQLINYEKTQATKEKTYLAPEEVRDIHLGRNQSIAEAGVAQSFSIGLTVIDAALLGNSQGLYENTERFDFEKLKSTKEKFLEDPDFNEDLKFILLSLIEESAEDRLSITELKDWMEPYIKNILQLEPFSFETVPKKVQRVMKRAQFYLNKKQEKSGMKILSSLFSKNSEQYGSSDEKLASKKKISEKTTIFKSSEINPLKTSSVYEFYPQTSQEHEKISISKNPVPQHNTIRRISEYRPSQDFLSPQNEYYSGVLRKKKTASPSSKPVKPKKINFFYEIKSNNQGNGPTQQSLAIIHSYNAEPSSQLIRKNSQQMNSQQMRMKSSKNHNFRTSPFFESQIRHSQKKRENRANSLNNKETWSMSIRNIDRQINLSQKLFPS